MYSDNGLHYTISLQTQKSSQAPQKVFLPQSKLVFPSCTRVCLNLKYKTDFSIKFAHQRFYFPVIIPTNKIQLVQRK